MSSDSHITPSPDNGAAGGPPAAAPPAAGLPTVAPPSGKLMVQLFLVPGLIVAFLVVAWLVGGWLFGVSYSKKEFLDKLNDPNAEVRWRAAEQLAQVLLRDDALASDGDFARRLGLMLQKTRDESRPAEKNYIDFLAAVAKEDLNEQQRKDKIDGERRKLEPDRTFLSFLTAALGDFMVPVGAPVLKELAEQKDGLDSKALVLRRRQAVWALANLGENLKRFDALPEKDKNAVLDKLQAASGTEDVEHPDWLRGAAAVLRKRAKHENDDMGVADALIVCSTDDDPYLRELSVFAMNFWRGDDAVNARMQSALLARTQDDGKGEDDAAGLSQEKDDSPTVALSDPKGLQIQYNAAVAMARFGGDKARLDMLKDMLDENSLKKKLVLRPRGRDDASQDKPNNEVIGQTLSNALSAVAELHRRRPDMDLSSLKQTVDALASSSGFPAARIEAEKTRLALSK
jgi:hypothetical protein